MRRLRPAIAIATSIFAAVAACSEAYDSAPSEVGPGEAGSGDGTTGDDASDARGGDAGVDVVLPPLAQIRGPCAEASSAWTCTPDMCPTRTLYAPTEPEFPFSLASDADYVYWASQPLGTEVDKTPAYNGERPGRVMRVSRTAGSKAVILAEGQSRMRALTLAGRYVYFGTSEAKSGGGWDVAIRRVPRDCAAPPCTAEHVVMLGAGSSVLRLKRVDDDTLFAKLDDGTVWRVALGAPAIATSVGGVLVGRQMTVSADDAFLGRDDGTPVYRVGKAALTAQPFGSIPDPVPDSGATVGAFLATDCLHVYGYRGVELVRSPVGTASFTHLANITPPSTALTFDVAADDRYVYVAKPNLGGMSAVAKQTGTRVTIAGGNVWEVHVDSDGVYWGEHDTNSPGAVLMMEKK